VRRTHITRGSAPNKATPLFCAVNNPLAATWRTPGARHGGGTIGKRHGETRETGTSTLREKEKERQIGGGFEGNLVLRIALVCSLNVAIAFYTISIQRWLMLSKKKSQTRGSFENLVQYLNSQLLSIYCERCERICFFYMSF